MSTRTPRRLVVSGGPGSGKTHLARLLSTPNACWVDAHAARSAPEIREAIAASLDANTDDPGRHHTGALVIEDVHPAIDLDEVTAQWPHADLIFTTIARPLNSTPLAPLTRPEALALWERASAEPPEPGLLEALRGHPVAIVTAAGRAPWSTPQMRQDPWDAMLWGTSSPLLASYQRAWRALDPEDQELLGACACLGDHLSPETLWPWVAFQPERLERLHATHWFERPWTLGYGERRFLETLGAERHHRALARWVTGQTISLATRFRTRGERRIHKEFQSIWPVLERVLLGPWVEDEARGAVLAQARGLIAGTQGFGRYDALTLRALQADISSDDRLLLKTYHQVYLGDRGERASALAKLHDWSKDARHLEASWRRASFFNTWGTLLTQSGNLQGLEILEDAYQDAMSCGDYASAMSQQIGLTRLNLHAHEPESARTHAMAALSLAEHGDMGLHVHICQGMLGGVLQELGDLEPAAKLLRQAAQGLGEDIPAYKGVFLGNLSLTLMRMKLLDEAIPVIRQSSEILERANNKFAAPKGPVHLAFCHYGLGEFARGRDWLDQALVALESLPLSASHLEAHALRAADAVRTGEDAGPWLRRCEDNTHGSSEISHDAVRALVSARPHTPASVWEEILWSAQAQGAVLELETRTLRIGAASHSFMRRPVAWNLLVAMARSPEAIDAWSLVEIGWPGQPLRDELLSRLYVTIKRLRDLGLGDWLQTTEDGYLLTRDVTLS